MYKYMLYFAKKARSESDTRRLTQVHAISNQEVWYYIELKMLSVLAINFIIKADTI